MSADPGSAGVAQIRRLESLLAVLLHYGTWLASVVIGLGLALALTGWLSGMRIVTAGIAFLILLPVLRVILMLIVFVRERDYRFIAITATVLLIILTGYVLGIVMSKAAP